MVYLKGYSDEDLAELMKMAISELNDSEYEIAFTEFFERYKKMILYLCIKFAEKRLVPQSLAEEIFSDFFFKFKSKISSFDSSKARSPQPLRAWLMRVLSNVASDVVRKYQKRRTGETLLSEQEWMVVDFYEEEEEPCEQPTSPEKERIESGLKALSQRDKEIIHEYYLQKPVVKSQRSPKGIYAEIGSQFETSADNVKKIILRFQQRVQGHEPQ